MWPALAPRPGTLGYAAAACPTSTVRANRAIMRKLAPWYALALVVVALDQLTKYWAGASFGYGEARAVTGFFNLVLTYNKGAAFSFLAGAAGWQRGFFIAIALAAVVVIGVLLARHPGENLFCLALALILGGAVGNVVDRIVLA